MNVVRFFFFILILSINFFDAKADTKILVTADRKALTEERASGQVILLNRNDIEKSGTQTLSELLSKQPGIVITQQGVSGGNTSLFLRGGEARHVQVLIDGVLVNDPSNPNRQFDFGHLNLASIEEIEILKGAQGVLYGSDAISGVISIKTRAGSRKYLSLSAGSYETYEVSAGTGFDQFQIAANFTDARGLSSAKTANETPDGRQNIHLHSSYKIQTKSIGDFILRGRYNQDHFDFDDFNQAGMPVDSQTNKTQQKENQQSLSWTHFLFQSLSVEAQISRYSLKREVLQKTQKSRFKGDHHQAQLHLTQQWSEQQYTLWGLEARFEDYEKDKKYSKEILTPFVFHRYDFQKYFISGGMRFNKENSAKEFLSYQASVGRIFENGFLKANYSTGHKNPSLFQLFDPLFGNTDLSSEKSQHGEISSRFEFLNNKLGVEISYFTTRLKNRFDFDPTSFRTINSGEAEISGQEYSVDYNWLGQKSYLAFQQLKTLDLKTGRRLIRRPRYLMQLGQELTISDWLNISFDYQFISSKKDFNEEILNSTSLWNLSFRGQLKKNLSYQASLMNLFDKDYETASGYNSPGRNWRVGFSYSF